MSPEYRGPKLVTLDRQAVVRRFAKLFCKEISKPGVRSITWVIERDDGINVQSSHRDDADAREVIRKALHTMNGW